MYFPDRGKYRQQRRSRILSRLCKASSRFGAAVVEYPCEGAIDFHLQLLLSRMRINAVVDVGANRGQFVKRIRGLGYAGDVISFEPVPDAFRALAQAASKEKKWVVRNAAGGKAAGEADFHIAKSDAVSSLKVPLPFFEKRFAGSHTVETVCVELVRLDDDPVIASWLDSRSVLVKIDVQGGELDVINGSTELLDNAKILILELAHVPQYFEQPDWLELIESCKQRGFLLSGIYPVTLGSNYQLLTSDAVLIRADNPR